MRHSTRGLRPLARHAPKRDVRAILLSVPRGERVPPLILRLTTRCLRLRSAALLSGGTSGSDTKTNSSLMDRSLRRQSLACGAVWSDRKARHSAGNCSSKFTWSGEVSRRWSRTGERAARDLAFEVDPLDRSAPPSQPPMVGVARIESPYVPQQMDPTPLLGAGVVVICGVEVACQHPTDALAQRLVDGRLAATATQEVPLPGSAERPHVAVGSALTPAGLVGVHHGASPNALQHVGHHRSGRLRHPVSRLDDGARADLQLIHRPQVGLDGPDRQPLLLTHRRYQAHQTDAQALPSHGHPVRRQPGNPASFACRASPRDQDVLGDLGRGRRYVDDLPGPLNSSARPIPSRTRDRTPERAPLVGWVPCAGGQSRAPVACAAFARQARPADGGWTAACCPACPKAGRRAGPASPDPRCVAAVRRWSPVARSWSPVAPR